MSEEHKECDIGNCRICEGYEMFQEFVQEDFLEFDAFHDVVTMIVEDFANTLIESVESDMSQGYILAMRDVADNATDVANRLEKDIASEDSHDKEEKLLIESSSDEYETEKTIFIEGELSDDEISEIVDRVSELSGDGDIEVVNVECGVNCGCEPITCLFDDYDDYDEENHIKIDIDSIHKTLEGSENPPNDGFLYGQEFVEWMEDKL